VNDNVRPTARDINRVALVGEVVVISNIITSTTGANNNLALATAIEILEYLATGVITIDQEAVFTFELTGVKEFSVRIPYRICDTDELCSLTAYITIRYENPRSPKTSDTSTLITLRNTLPLKTLPVFFLVLCC
jgi:hypothetical protein